MTLAPSLLLRVPRAEESATLLRDDTLIFGQPRPKLLNPSLLPCFDRLNHSHAHRYGMSLNHLSLIICFLVAASNPALFGSGRLCCWWGFLAEQLCPSADLAGQFVDRSLSFGPTTCPTSVRLVILD